MRALIDSDVLIDYLQGLERAKIELERYSQPEISIISWMEVMAGAESPQETRACDEFLSSFAIHQLSMEIAAEAVELRKKFRVRPPDAIVWATARIHSCILVTRNSKDFDPAEPGIRIPYLL